MNSVHLWRAVGAHNSAKQSLNLQVYPANTLELTFYFCCRVTASWHCFTCIRNPVHATTITCTHVRLRNSD